MNQPGDSDATPGPSRPEKLTVEFYEEPDGIAVHKNRGGGPGCFLLLWLIGWSVGCVALIGVVVHEPSIGMLAFAVPFWASWLAVASFLVWIRFGKETLLLRRDKALFLRTAIVKISSRFVPREEIRYFRECRSNQTENDVPLRGIEMVTLGKPLRFAFRLPDSEREWLVFQLNRYLRTTGPLVQRKALELAAPSAEGVINDAAICAETSDSCEMLTYEHTSAEPPSDSDWRLTDEVDFWEISQQGRLSIGTILGAVFINLFWNGVVSVFVLLLLGVMPNNIRPQGIEWWGLFVFLIPFEAIGLVMVAALVLAVLEPFRRTAWRFEHDRITSQTRWPVFRRTRAWEVDELDRLDLRCLSGDPPTSKRLADIAATTLPFALALVATGNVDLCRIENLTEGEARWLARLVLERRPTWFAK